MIAVTHFFELLMIFSDQLQCLHQLGVGTRGTLLGWAASLMPQVS